MPEQAAHQIVSSGITLFRPAFRQAQKQVPHIQNVPNTKARSQISMKDWCMQVAMSNFHQKLYFGGGFYLVKFGGAAPFPQKIRQTLNIFSADATADNRVEGAMKQILGWDK